MTWTARSELMPAPKRKTPGRSSSAGITMSMEPSPGTRVGISCSGYSLLCPQTKNPLSCSNVKPNTGDSTGLAQR